MVERALLCALTSDNRVPRQDVPDRIDPKGELIVAIVMTDNDSKTGRGSESTGGEQLRVHLNGEVREIRIPLINSVPAGHRGGAFYCSSIRNSPVALN